MKQIYNLTKKALAIMLLLALPSFLFAQTTYYVDANTANNGDGLSWANAKMYLQDALTSAVSGDQIWVAKGVYYPDLTGSNTSATFTLIEGVKMYGGFAGTETLLTERDLAANLTILSGDIDNNDANYGTSNIAETYTDIVGSNSLLILTADGNAGNITAACEVDGFVVTAASGGALFCRATATGSECSPTIANCYFLGNKNTGGGGAVLNSTYNNGVCNGTFTNCNFSGNNSGAEGGAIHNVLNGGSTAIGITIKNCSFTNNSAQWGGVIFFKAVGGTCTASLTNCSFSNNVASDIGGVIYSETSYSSNYSPVFTNCSFANNIAVNNGGALANVGISSSCTPIFTNCILWGNSATNSSNNEIYNSGGTPTFSYSDIAGSGGSSAWVGTFGTNSGNNIDADPTFVNVANNALRLLAGSPAIDAGNNAANTEPYDLAGNARIQNTTIDMGAYEGGVTSSIYYVDADKAIDLGDGLTWATAKKYLQSVMALAVSGDQIWVADGVYYADEGTGQTNNSTAATFTLIEGIKIYGGFAGTETLLTQRDLAVNKTILSGDIQQDDTNSDGNNIAETTADVVGLNSIHIVTASVSGATINITSATELDGFYVTAGNSTSSSGGGLSCQAIGTSSVATSSPTLANCSFMGNNATSNGGAIYISAADGYASPKLINCAFSGNNASQGGAIFLFSDYTGTVDPTFTNCSFTNNTASYGGGVRIQNDYSCSPTFTNCILWGNTATTAYNDFFFDNSYGLPTFSYSDIAGSGGSGAWVAASFGTDGGNNIDADPTFYNASNNDLRLIIGSPAIDAGDNTANTEPFDLAGNARIQNTTIDMGAYEGGFPAPPKTIYVDITKTDNTGDGLSWATAKKNLQDGLTMAVSSDEIWVADGVYYADEGTGVSGGDKTASYNLIEGVKMYGGFAGTETLLTERNWDNNPTILSGDIDQNDINTDGNFIAETTDDLRNNNTYNILFADGSGTNITGACEVNGFIITAGWTNINGGGLYCNGEGSGNESSPSIKNCTFSGNLNNNAGGAVYNTALTGGTASPSFTSCIFTGNKALGDGGAIYNASGSGGISSPIITNCNFLGNSAAYGGAIHNKGWGGTNPSLINCSFTDNSASTSGGAFYNQSLSGGTCSPSYVNCSFAGNSASSDGGAIFDISSTSGICSPSLTNCSFSGNTAAYGGAIHNKGNGGTCSPSLTNCISWGNTATTTSNEIYNVSATPTFSYCDIEGSGGSASWAGVSFGTDGGNNIDSDPTFYNASNDDLRLIIGSPAIDAGNNAANTETTDLAGNARIQNTTIDMGAYEGGIIRIFYVDADETDDTGDGLSWAAAKKYLQSALALATSGDQIWVADGVYYPDEGTGQTNNSTAATFTLIEGIKIYGGFAGTETLLTERDWAVNKTILSGDIEQDDTNTDGNNIAETYTDIVGSNSLLILTADGNVVDITAACEVDGFVLTAGSGGALYCLATATDSESSPTIANCDFSGNKKTGGGGAVLNSTYNNGECNGTFTNCNFSGNNSGQEGGAIHNYANGGAAKIGILINNCSFTNNSSQWGGAIFFKSKGTCTASLTNCSFSGNHAIAEGGVIYNETSSGGSCSPSLTNCSFAKNSAGNKGGSITSVGTNCTPSFTNCILWGNSATTSNNEIYNNNATPTFSYSDIAGSRGSSAWEATFGTDGGNNIATDPTFVDAANNNLRLYVGSPAIDAGNNAANTEPFDLAGNARIQNTSIDMGAYEGGVLYTPIYVDASRTDDTGNGLTWATAKKYLQSGMALAVSGDQIWVADGVYYPDEGTSQTNDNAAAGFWLKENVKIYGGFAGTETLPSERDWLTNLTILSGDITQNDLNTDNNFIAEVSTDVVVPNSNHIIYADATSTTSLSSATELDGFYITAGNNLSDGGGGGLFCRGITNNALSSPTIANCKFLGNKSYANGGAVLIKKTGIGTVNPSFTNCLFSGNSGNALGGAVFSTSYQSGTCSPTFTNCSFSNNSNVGSGAGISIHANGATAICNPILTNCSFSENNAGASGGAMTIQNLVAGGACSPVITNCVVWDNTATTSDNNIHIITATPTYSYCDIARSGGSGAGWVAAFGTDGGNNIDSDPTFVDAANDDLRLFIGSPAIDAGNNTANSELFDLAGNARIQNTSIDMGAYEGGVLYTPIYVDASRTDDTGDGLSWATAKKYLQSGLAMAAISYEPIWVADGVYYPDEGTGQTNNSAAATFNLIEGIKIYGGFAGTENSPTERDWAVNKTILSGDIDKNDANYGTSNIAETTADVVGLNSKHIVTASVSGATINITSATELDGFYVTAGKSTADGGGGGLLGSAIGSTKENSPQVKNCSFLGNNTTNQHGGAVMFQSSSAGICKPSFISCNFTGNSTLQYGGAIFSSVYLSGTASPTLINCSFSNNSTTQRGGAISIHANGASTICNPSIINCSFAENNADIWGGALALQSISGGVCVPIITNCIVWGNTAPTGPNIYNSLTTPTYSYCDIEGNGASGTNIDSDPTFYNASNNDLRLIIGSPAIDAGNNAANTEYFDLAGNARIQNTSIDMGAYEGGVPAPPKTIYVDITKTDNLGDGLSWATAKKNLQDGLTMAVSTDEVWVADGVYYADEGTGMVNNNKNAQFVLIEGVKMYGGFVGTETLLTERDWAVNKTILSGDIDKNDINTDGNFIAETPADLRNVNTYNILFASGNTGTITGACEVDGFIITAGWTGGDGAGLYCISGSGNESSPSIKNCTFSGNKSDEGGAIFNYSASGISSPTITNCNFSGNGATYGGVCMNKGNSATCNPSLINCSFTNNSASVHGGVFYNQNQSGGSNSPSYVNCSFAANSAGTWGGAFVNQNNGGPCTPTFTNCVLWGNTATTGPNIHNISATPTISYCDIEGSGGSASWAGVTFGTDGGNNIDSDPTFIDAATNDLRLLIGSPAIDAGNNAANTETTDLAGNTRILNTTIDMGAYEGGVFSILYVDADRADDTGDGLTWATAKQYLQSGLALATSGLQIWVADGVYYADDGITIADPRNASFTLIEGVKMYGGFVGTETLLTERDWDNNLTILSGDIDHDDTNTDGNFIAETPADLNGSNTYNILFASGNTGTITGACEVDGFIITAGWTGGDGGGLYCISGSGNVSSPSIKNCTFSGNKSNEGGAIFNYSASGISSPTITNCNFSGNSAAYGGVCMNKGTSATCNPSLINCSFTNNSASVNGGVFYNQSSNNGSNSPSYVNCSFAANSAVTSGGAFVNQSYSGGTCTPTFTNCVVWGNTAPTGPNIHNLTATPTFSYCDIEGSGGSASWAGVTFGTDGGNNIDSDPEFEDAPNNDLRLTPCSASCIDAGNNAANSATHDLAGAERVQNINIDKGAYELALNGWNGSGGTAWNTATNWNNGTVPLAEENVVITNAGNQPVIAYNATATCANLDIESGASITLASTAAGTASLIVNSTCSGDVVNVQRYLTADHWHYISGPVAGQPLNPAWLSNNSVVSTPSDQLYRWDEDSNYWIQFGYVGSEPEDFGDATFVDSRGYIVTTSVSGAAAFTGTVRTSTVNYPATYTADKGKGNNLIGNPFTSTIAINEDAQAGDNFLADNAAILDDNYQAIYIWNEVDGYIWGDSDYGVVCNTGFSGSGSATQLDQDFVQPGQAFMVRVKEAGNVVFDENIRKHGAAEYYKSDESWPGLELRIGNNDLRNTTIIAFNANMTNGLNPSYDVVKIKGNPDLALYSHLVESTGKDYAVQALSDQNIEEYIIPIGVDVLETGVFEFSVYQEYLDNYNITLEDRKENTFTNLRWDTYFATISESGTGRFYLHFKDATGIEHPADESTITLRHLNGMLQIHNPNHENGIIRMVNISGQVLMHLDLSGDELQEFGINHATGIYIISIQTEKSNVSRKIFIK